MTRAFPSHFAALFCLLAGASSLRAVTLDWDAVPSYTSTQPNSSNSYDVDPSASAPGSDITVQVIRGATLGSGTATDAVTQEMEGGFPLNAQGLPQNALVLTLDLDTQSQYITVTVTFSPQYAQGVQNVSFNLFDIDFSNQNGNGFKFQDQIRSITATSIDGVTQIAPTITGSANNTVSGTGLNKLITGNNTTTTPNTGPGSGDANATISFGGNAIKSFTFVYGSGSDTVSNPEQQKIALQDITFTPVPEMNPAWSAVVSCIAAAGLILRHRANTRK